jgi:hypothetical protein
MDKTVLLNKLIDLKKKCEETSGPVTDIWLPDEWMQILDDRDILTRLNAPFMLDETYITNFSPLEPTQIRIAFLTNLEDK